jgi:hypothetical protein
MEGRGHLRLPSGDDYEGDFVADRPHGIGRYTAADGTSFHGSFLNGQREGVGVLTLGDGKSYRSHWEIGREIARTPLAQQRVRPPGTIPPVPGAGGVVLNRFVDRKMNTEFKSDDPDNESFVYEGVRAGNLLTLRLDSKELMGLWKETPRYTGIRRTCSTPWSSSRRFFLSSM